jgi:hypothetical protein
LITPELDGIDIYPCSINAHFEEAFIEKAGRSIGYFPRAARINRLASTGYDVRFGHLRQFRHVRGMSNYRIISELRLVRFGR